MVCVIFASISSIWSDVFSSAVWQYSIRDAASAYNLTASLSPYRVLARGYAMITTGRGQILPADQLEPDKTIYIRSASRRAKCRVEAVEEIDESTQKL